MVEVGQGTCDRKVACLGLFSRADGKIYLSEKVDIYSDLGKSVIVHELRHYQQALTCGPLKRGPLATQVLGAGTGRLLHAAPLPQKPEQWNHCPGAGHDSPPSDGKRLPEHVARTYRVLNGFFLKTATVSVG